jgi:hypothetical protein
MGLSCAADKQRLPTGRGCLAHSTQKAGVLFCTIIYKEERDISQTGIVLCESKEYASQLHERKWWMFIRSAALLAI